MLRQVAAKVMWVGRATVFTVGLAVIVGLVLGVATTASGANGGNFILGQGNAATALTRLTGDVQGSAMQIINNHPGSDDSALNLQVQDGEAPMRTTSDTRVNNLNADKVDGLGAEEIGVNGVEQVEVSSAFDSDSLKNPTAECPEGKALVGTASDIFGGRSGNFPDQLTDVVVTGVVPSQTSSGIDRVTAVGVEEEPTTDFWRVRVVAFCATDGTP